MELWESDDCIKKSEINAKNRRGGHETAALTHTGGSISMGEYRKRLAIKKGRDRTPGGLHLHVHTHGHDGKSFVDERSRIVHELSLSLTTECLEFQALCMIKYSLSFCFKESSTTGRLNGSSYISLY